MSGNAEPASAVMGVMQVDAPANAQGSLASSAAAEVLQSDTAPSLDKIPDDMLLQIWTLLDDPACLARTSRRFAAFSKDPFFRAKWFLAHYTPYEVIFHAIARPKLFDEPLLKRLLSGGAPLSRHIVQLFHLSHGSYVTGGLGSNSDHLLSDMMRWGASITLSAYVAVLAHGIALYGDIPFNASELDECTFNHWLGSTLHGRAPEVTPQIKDLLVTYRYAALPIRLKLEPQIGEHGIVQLQQNGQTLSDRLLLQVPELAKYLFANGFRGTYEGSLWLSRKLFSEIKEQNDIHFEMFGDAEAGEAASQIADGPDEALDEFISKVQVLVDSRMFQIPRRVASNIIMGLRSSSSISSCADSDEEAVRRYDALRLLEQLGKLPFALKDVVRELVDLLGKDTIDFTMIPMLERLEQDYPDVPLDSAFAQAMFLKKCLQRVDKPIADLIGRRSVTRLDVWKACLHNIDSVGVISYAIENVTGFDAVNFVKELVEVLVDQPYRGQALRALNQWSSGRWVVQSSARPPANLNFRAILARAIEQKSFTSAALPAHEWFKGARKEASSVCSLLAFNRRAFLPAPKPLPPSRRCFGFRPYQRQESPAHVDESGVATGPADLPMFTCFGVEPEQSAGLLAAQAEASSVEIGESDASSSVNAVAHAAAEMLRQVGAPNRLDGVEPIRLQELIPSLSRVSNVGQAEARQQREFNRQRYLNVSGPNNEETLCTAILSILGAKSRAAEVLLAHSIANQSHKLSDQLFEAGVAATFEHAKIALKVGTADALPAGLLTYIQDGGQFKASIDAPADQADDEWRYTGGLTAEVELQCAAWKASPWDGGRIFSVDLDAAGQLRIERKVTKSAQPAKYVATTALSPLSDESSGEARLEADEAVEVAPSDEAETCAVSWPSEPVIMLQSERKRRLKSVKLWIDHLAPLCDFITDMHMAVGRSTPEAGMPNPNVKSKLCEQVDQLRVLAAALQAPSRVTRVILAREEMAELEAELQSAESKERISEIKALVQRRSKVNKWFAYQRRAAWKKSLQSKPAKLVTKTARGAKDDDDSNDSDFEASLTQTESSSSDDSDAESADDGNSTAAQQRTRRGKQRESQASSSSGLVQKGKGRAVDAPLAQTRKRARSVKEEDSDSDVIYDEERNAALGVGVVVGRRKGGASGSKRRA